MPKKYLIDTQILLWLNGQSGSKLTPTKTKELKLGQLYVSIASYWEIAIKSRNKKLDIGMSINDFMLTNEYNGIKTINITSKHLGILERLKKVDGHNDPFDHMIVATSIAEKMDIKSFDNKIPEYFNT